MRDTMSNKMLVLVGSDGKPENAFRKAVELAEKEKSELHVLIYNTTLKENIALEESEEFSLEDSYMGELTVPDVQLMEDLDEENQAEIKEFVSSIKLSNPDNLIISYVSYGLKKAVLNYANEKEIDLVILGQEESLYIRLTFDSLIKHLANKSASNLLIIK